MAKKSQKVYMPLVHGDWLKGTQGMRAEVRGVYLNLLLFQWNNGSIPKDWDDLCMIDPEVPKVWDKLKVKFEETSPGFLQNDNLEEIREFWSKQKKNGKKGGRKPNDKPKPIPNSNPNDNHHNDIDLDNDSSIVLNKKELTEKVEKLESAIDFEPSGDESLDDVMGWTKDVIEGNDPFFSNMLRNEGLVLNGQLDRLARDHLTLCGRYNWHEKMTTQTAFRISLIGHVTKELASPEKAKQSKKELTLEELKAKRNGSV